jgi:hypothetical protein
MARARRPRPRPPRRRRPPDWLPAALAVTAQVLAAVVAIHGGVVAPVGGECPGGRPVAAVVRGDAGRMPESGANTLGGTEGTGGLTRVNVVGRDGIEPPTLRFSAARSTD